MKKQNARFKFLADYLFFSVLTRANVDCLKDKQNFGRENLIVIIYISFFLSEGKRIKLKEENEFISYFHLIFTFP